MATAATGDIEAGFAKLQGEDFEYYMQTYSIILGWNSKKSSVDVDLSSLGGEMNISHHHARIFYDFTGRRFALEVLGFGELVCLSGYSNNVVVVDLLASLCHMCTSGTLVSLIQGCSQTCNLESGKILHACSIRKGLESNLILPSAIVDMYAKCGAAKQATTVFGRMKERNVITWTAMQRVP